MPAPIGPEPQDIRLGRFPQFDPRSRSFTFRTLLDQTPPKMPRSYTWARAAQLDQGQTPECVGFSWMGEVGSKPKPRLVDSQMADEVYHLAQTTYDEWPGENYEGTSVLAGVKAAIAKGYYPQPTPTESTYRWAGAGSGRALEDLALAIGYYGPAVLGINWHHDMFSPDVNGFIHPTGNIDGGHAIEARGVTVRWPVGLLTVDRRFDNLDMNQSYFRLTNSWGSWWGISGECFISFADLQSLLLDSGEACIIVRR